MTIQNTTLPKKNYAKKILSCFALTLVLIGFNSCTSADKQQVKQLQVTNSQLTDNQGNVMQLRGISLGWHNWWSEFYNEEVISTLKNDWNADIVRAAMGVDPDTAYLDNPIESKKHIITVVDAAIANDMYVIIDWHAHKLHLNESKAFFAEMATKYKGVPNVIYEIFNEPVDETWAEIKEYSIEVIKTIRAIEPDAIILVSAPRWAQDVNEIADDPIVGYENIMYTLHFYAATHKEELRAKADYALEKKLPIFVSECASMEASGDGSIDLESWNTWREWMDKNQLSWIMWSISNKDETCSMILPEGGTTGNWDVEDLKPWGQISRELLRKY